MSGKLFRAGGCVVLFFMTALLEVSAAPRPRLSRLNDGTEYREDRILIIPKAGRAAALGRFHGQTGARLRKAFPNLGNIHVLELPEGVSARDVLDRYRRSGHVEAADLDVVLKACALPNDPFVANGTQWHLNNFGQSSGVFGADIHASEAWDIQNSASNIIVAVVDSGVRLTHQDIAANLWVNPGEIPGNGIDDDGNGVIDDVNGMNATVTPTRGNVQDFAGHGTHVAGILGAVGDNGIGVSGIARNVRIMACQFLDASGTGYLSDMAECLNYAKANGARIANCSFEIAGTQLNASNFAIMSNAFWNMRTGGVLVTAAAGNSGWDIDAAPVFPACFAIDNILSVMASTRYDSYLAYNFGLTMVDLAAPGIEIQSTYNRSDSDYFEISGTSMAAPCVAGAAALVMAKFPDLTAQQVITRILGTVDVLPAFQGRCVTGGRLNAARALQGGYGIHPATYSWVPTNGMVSLTLADDGISTSKVLPFTVKFGGKSYTNFYIGANGLVGLGSQTTLFLGSNSTANTDLPTSQLPNSIICPLWDNLNPAASGAQVWWGTNGVAPNRSVVVSWVNVPHFVTAGGQTKFTFQVVLYENQNIRFQYAAVDAGHPQYVRGLSATIGLEDFAGGVAAKYSYDGSAVVTNGQSMLFIPDGRPGLQPTLQYVAGPGAGGYQFLVKGHPFERCVVQVSTNLVTWTGLVTNLLPSDGVLPVQDAAPGLKHRFYRAVMKP